MTHKFIIGQTVFFVGPMLGKGPLNSPYRVMRLLPPEGGDFQYRIKSVGEAYERVVKESQLEHEL